MSAKSLIRNGVFAVLALFLVGQGSENQGLSFFDSTNNNSEGNAMELFIGLATVGLLAAVVYFLKLISEQQTQIMRRIEILELTAHDGTREVQREDVAHPDSGKLGARPSTPFYLCDIKFTRSP